MFWLAGADLLGLVEQLRVGDDVAERGVLEDDHQLADERRQHRGDGLRQQDQPQRLALAQADREARLALSLGQGDDAGAHDLGDDRGVVERQADDDRGQRELRRTGTVVAWRRARR